MENEKSEAYDSHEQELQRTYEIQTLSEEVLNLVQGDDGPPPSTHASSDSLKMQEDKELNIQPPTRTESMPVMGISSDSYALKTQAAQELIVQPPQRRGSASAQLLNNHARPGAYYAAPGTLSSASRELVTAEYSPRFMQGESGVTTEDCLGSSGQGTTSASSEGTLVSAVRVEAGAEEQRFRRRMFDEAIKATSVELVAESPQEEHDNRKWRKLSVYLLIACGVLALLGLIIGLRPSVGSTKKNDASGEDETPPQLFIPTTPSELFVSTLEAVRQRGVLRCGHPDVFYHIRYDPVTGERVGFEIDLVSSLFMYFGQCGGPS